MSYSGDAPNVKVQESSAPNERHECLFCEIISGSVESAQVYSDDCVVAIRDISPQAPIHILVLPKEHFPTVDVLREDPGTAGRLIAAAVVVAHAEGLHETGYRIVVNHGEHGAQSVGHVHFHVLGGRQLSGILG